LHVRGLHVACNIKRRRRPFDPWWYWVKGHAYMGDDTGSGAGGAGADAPPKRRRRSSKWKTKVRAQALLRLLFA
jgi:hypothetical protein